METSRWWRGWRDAARSSSISLAQDPNEERLLGLPPPLEFRARIDAILGRIGRLRFDARLMPRDDVEVGDDWTCTAGGHSMHPNTPPQRFFGGPNQ